MNDRIQHAESELGRLRDLLSLLEMSAGTLPAESKGPMTAGLDLAITSVIDLQNQMAEMRASSTAGS